MWKNVYKSTQPTVVISPRGTFLQEFSRRMYSDSIGEFFFFSFLK